MSGEARLQAVVQMSEQFSTLSEIILRPPEVNIGRSLANKYIIPHVGISRQHCQFKFTNNKLWTINDTSSVGILVNDLRIPKNIDHPLKKGDIIQFDYFKCFMYKFFYDNSDCDNNVKTVCNYSSSDIINWIQNSQNESDIFKSSDLNNFGSQLQNFEEKRVAAVNQKTLLETNYKEDLCRLEKSYHSQVKDLKGDSENIRQQQKEILINIQKEKQTLEQQFKTTTESLEGKIKEYESQVNILIDENKTLIENFSKERKAFEKQIEEITTISDKKVEDLEKKLNEKNSDIIKEREIMQNKSIEDAKILKSHMDLVTEYKNKCIALEAAKKESEDKLTSKIAEIETISAASLKRTHDDMESSDSVKLNVCTEYTNILDSELVCTICFEHFIDATSLNCSHTFCKFCIRQWRKNSKDCPMCRVTISSEIQNRIIDSVIEKILLKLDDDMKNKRQQMIEDRRREPVKEIKSKRRKVRRRQRLGNEVNLLPNINGEFSDTIMNINPHRAVPPPAQVVPPPTLEVPAQAVTLADLLASSARVVVPVSRRPRRTIRHR